MTYFGNYTSRFESHKKETNMLISQYNSSKITACKS